MLIYPDIRQISRMLNISFCDLKLDSLSLLCTSYTLKSYLMIISFIVLVRNRNKSQLFCMTYIVIPLPNFYEKKYEMKQLDGRGQCLIRFVFYFKNKNMIPNTLNKSKCDLVKNNSLYFCTIKIIAFLV